jgi:hypothetical protein
MKPKTCFSYYEEKINPGVGAGTCLQVHETVKGQPMAMNRKCADVLREGKCPRKHTYPYLKGKERS